MPRDSEKTRRGIRPKDLLPRWYMNIDASVKPLIGAVAVLVVVIPSMIYAWRQVGIMNDSRTELNALLDSGTGTKAQLNALSGAATRGHDEDLHDLLPRSDVRRDRGRLECVADARPDGRLAEAADQATQRAAEGDLSHDIRRDNESQIGDIQEALGKMIASFRATIHRIEAAADELREAADEMAHTSDEAGHAIGEVAQSISAISEGAAHQVDLVTRTGEVVAEIETAVRGAAEHADEAQRQSAETEHLTEEGVQRATEVQEAMQVVRETSQATAEVVPLARREVDQHRPDRPGDHRHRLTDQSFGAQRGDRGRPRGRAGPRIRRGRRGGAQARRRRSGSAGDIAGLILEIRDQTDQAVTAMDEGMNTVEAGFETVNQNRQIFFDISAAVRSLHQSSAEIAQLANGIAVDAGNVREQIEEVATVAEESSASTEQVSASTEETSAAAKRSPRRHSASRRRP